jgi:hypothetical protein
MLKTTKKDVTLDIQGNRVLDAQIALADQSGGLTIIQTDKEVLVTAVEQKNISQKILNTTNNPSGTVTGEIQFKKSDSFSSTPDLMYNEETNTLVINGSVDAKSVIVQNLEFADSSNLVIPGGLPGQTLVTDGAGSLTWATPLGSYGDSDVGVYLPSHSGPLGGSDLYLSGNSVALKYTGLNLEILTSAILPTTTTGNLTSTNITAANVIGGNISGDGYDLHSLNGANILGEVSNSAHANSVEGGNVIGSVSSSLEATHVVGSFQPNIISVGTLTSLNVTGTINSGNITSTGFHGDGSGLHNLNGSNVIGSVPSAVLSDFVVEPIQSNITAVGTLVSLDVTGAIVADSLSAISVTGDHYGDAGNLANISGSNVVGVVLLAEDANTANYAGNVTVSTQPNITTVGTLTSLNVSGNTVIGGNLTLQAVSRLRIPGGTVGQVLSTNGSSGLYWGTVGDVTGPILSDDNRVVRFNGVTGKTIQQTNITIDDFDNITGSNTITQNVNTATSLPAPVAGARSFVSDATSNNWGDPVVGGGSSTVPVWSDGIAWFVG